MSQDRDASVQRELNMMEWDAGMGTMLEVCRDFIRGAPNRIVEEQLQFVNGNRRGVIGCKVYPPGRNAYYRDGRVFEINTMMVSPSGGDIVHRTALALFGDRSLGIDCIRIESVLDDSLLRRYVRKGWVLRSQFDNSPLLTREAYIRIQTNARRITRAFRRARSKRNAP